MLGRLQNEIGASGALTLLSELKRGVSARVNGGWVGAIGEQFTDHKGPYEEYQQQLAMSTK